MAKKALGYRDTDGNFGFKFTEDGRVYLGNTADDIVSVTGTLDVNGNVNIYNDVVVRNTTYGYDSSATHYQENFEGLSDGSTSDPSTSGTWTNGLGSENGADIENGYAWIAEDTDGNSSTTGPDNAHSGSMYVFTEATNRNNKYYTLQRSFTADQSRVISKLSLYYHMYGSNMGSLSVYASGSYANSGGWVQLDITRDADGSPATASTISGQQHSAEDEAYKRAEVDLETYSGTAFSLRIVGLTGGGYPSDLAIDAIEFIPRQVTLNVSPTNISSSVPFSGSTFSANSFHGSFYGSGTGLTSIPDSALASNSVIPAKIDTSVAGSGLTGGGGSALAVGAGTGVTVNTNDVAIGQAVGTGDTVEFSKATLNTSAIGSGEVMRIKGTGDNFNTFVVFGTDTTSEYVSLGINSSGNPTITGGYSGTTETSNLCFATQEGSGVGEAVKMILDNEGSLGIGLSTAINYGQLEVYKNSSTSAANITIHQDHADGDSRLHLRSNANDWYIINDGGDDDLVFNNEGTERMRLSNGGDLTVTGDLFVNDYARIDALRVGTTSTDPGDGNLYIEGDITLAGGDIKDSGGHSRISFTDLNNLILKDYSGNTEMTISTSGVDIEGDLLGKSHGRIAGEFSVGTRVIVGDSLANISDSQGLIQVKQTADDENGGGLTIEQSATSDEWTIWQSTAENLNFSFNGSSKGYLNDGANVSNITFTGQHRCSPSDSSSFSELSSSVGKIVVSDGTYSNLQQPGVSINESIPKVDLSTSRNQKSVFGVVSDAEDENSNTREYSNGTFVTVAEKSDSSDNRLYINSLGEGGIWITNINGNIENGDYITTCEIPGYGMKQDDDLLHNYTVAKITQDCLFDLNSTTYECEEIQHNGQTYRAAFVGCTYHCG